MAMVGVNWPQAVIRLSYQEQQAEAGRAVQVTEEQANEGEMEETPGPEREGDER